MFSAPGSRASAITPLATAAQVVGRYSTTGCLSGTRAPGIQGWRGGKKMGERVTKSLQDLELSSSALKQKQRGSHDVARACLHQHAVCDVAGAAQPPPSPCESPPRRKWPLASPLITYRAGARSVFGELLSAEEPDRRRDDGCHLAIVERREERLLLLGVHHARAPRWLLVCGLLFMPQVPRARLPVRQLRVKCCSRCFDFSPRCSALAEYNGGMSPWHTVPT